ncbi:MAG: DUF4864 domain-containing protein [Pseudomonadota bacterium]
MRHLLASFLLLFGLHGSARAADAFNAPDAQQMRAVVQAQLDAFAAGDAAAAFAHAAPGVRQMFGTPEAFMAMVRSGYAVVVRPASVQFHAPRQVDGQWILPVQMVDAAGATWGVLYHLQQQPDGAWRISGCEVVRRPGRMA